MIHCLALPSCLACAPISECGAVVVSRSYLASPHRQFEFETPPAIAPRRSPWSGFPCSCHRHKIRRRHVRCRCQSLRRAIQRGGSQQQEPRPWRQWSAVHSIALRNAGSMRSGCRWPPPPPRIGSNGGEPPAMRSDLSRRGLRLVQTCRRFLIQESKASAGNTYINHPNFLSAVLLFT